MISDERSLVRSELLELPTMEQLSALHKYASILVSSGLLPYQVNTPEKAMTIILKGRELGIPPMLALSQIVIINGKPAMQSELMLALIYKKLPDFKMEILRSDAEGCIIKVSRDGKNFSEFPFLKSDAERAELFEKSRNKGKGPGPWLTYPTAMYRARCISAMARILAPDVILGVSYTPEELESIEKDVTPSAVQEKEKVIINHAEKIQKEKEEEEIKKKLEAEEREFKLKVWSEIKLVNENLKHDLNKYFFSLFGKEIKDCTLCDFQEALSQLKILRGENGK